FTTVNNKVYSSTLNLSDGDKVMMITARSFAGVVATIPLYFVVNAFPLGIFLVSPPYGASAVSPFDVVVRTDNDAECRHSTGSQSEFSFMEPFSSTSGTEHTISSYSRASASQAKLFVTCNDPLQGKKTVSFLLSFDNTPPTIITAFAFPDPVQDDDNSTQLTVQTNEDTICKYSKAGTSIGAMTPFDSYASGNFSKISRQTITETGEGRFTYFVACHDKALLPSATQSISFSLNHTLPTLITSLTPSILGNENLQLLVKTSKKVQCRFSRTDHTAAAGTLFGPSSFVHTAPLALEDGNYTFYVACKDQFLPGYSNAILVNFTVDTQPPTMLFVDDSSTFTAFQQQSCFTDRLRVRWGAQDQGSGVREYFYAILKGSTEIVGFTKSFVSNEFIFIKNLSLLDNTKYTFRVKSRDYMDLESQPLLSDGVVVDTSLCSNLSKCGDGKINMAGEECDGATFGTVKNCSQYSNLGGGTLKCTPQCRLDTSDCSAASSCGNGILDQGEACDGKSFGKINSCTGFNGAFTSGTLGCTPSCELDTSSCTERGHCGNGLIDAGESCDGNSFGPLDGACDSYSPLRFTSGSLKCTNCQIDTSSCQDVSSGLCGDGVLNKGETCDGNSLGAIEGCTSYASFTGGELSCGARCTINTSQCTEQVSCGNGVINMGESCDGNMPWQMPSLCTNYSSSFKSGQISCTNCALSAKECTSTQEDRCGNNKLDTGELCDGLAVGSNISSVSCMAYSPYFLNGTLNCRACRLTTDTCLSNESITITCRDRGDCATGTNCTASADCNSGFCKAGVCAAPTCTDGITNQAESGIDCGGPCKTCTEGGPCRENKDCETNLCSFGFCKESGACNDGQLTPGEAGVDCGQICDAPCGQGAGCQSSLDCVSGLECRQGTCMLCAVNDEDCDGVPDDQPQGGSSDDEFIQWAIEHELDVSNPNLGSEDPDGDGLSNLEEFSRKTDPLNGDSDGDGFSDAEEIDAGTDPLDPEDYPSSSFLSTILMVLLVLALLGGAGYFVYNRYIQNAPSPSTRSSRSFSLPSVRQQPAPQEQRAALPPQSPNIPSLLEKKMDEKFKEKHEREKREREKVFSA
ncbi:MAG: hypothetical protein HY518_05930, partial [Candidatus Aenigmarchaeota archaeon]|nr:hypothetical protein [Candidatus Aenigmarchaeota archaeon]